MEVTCERCTTAYEFDDALVSERGTTVKCTTCGHQFRVRRQVAGFVPEVWIVRTRSGGELEFRALRELQAAIAELMITRDDVLVRGGSRPRRLGSVAELEPFFANAGSQVQRSTAPGIGTLPPPAPRPRVPTPQGLGAVSSSGGTRTTEGSIAIPLPAALRMALREPAEGLGAPRLPGQPVQRSLTPPVSDTVATTIQTLRPPTMGMVVAPAGAPPLPPPLAPPAPMPGQRTLATPVDEIVPAYIPPPVVPIAASPIASPAASDMFEPLPDDMAFPRATASLLNESAASYSRMSSPGSTPTPSNVLSTYGEESYGEPRFTGLPPRRSGAVRWIAGSVIAGIFALGFATLGPRLVASSSAPAGSGVADARIGAHLASGESSLADGDFESAKEQFDKASGIAERDPRVAADLARLAAVRADFAWLRVRLLPDGDPDAAAAKRELDHTADRAAKAVEFAAQIAPAEPEVLRDRINALRIAGDLDGARKLIGGIATASSQPENALTLATLNLAEAKPDWGTVIGRLRAAAVAEQGHSLARARALLIFALARSGDTHNAMGELDKLDALPRPHPLARALRNFATRAAPPDAPASAAAPKKGAPQAASSPPARDTPAAAPPHRDEGGGARPGRAARPAPREETPEPPARATPQPAEEAPPSGHVDTSDLPGAHAPSPGSPSVDTSDLPGVK